MFTDAPIRYLSIVGLTVLSLTTEAQTQGQPNNLTVMMQAAVHEAQRQSGAPAFGAVVVRGADTFMASSGHRTMRQEIPVTDHDPWHIGSVTKSMTATLAARLIDQEVLSWDDSIGSLLASLQPEMHDQYRGATLIHFLAHRSGMRLDRNEFNERMTGYTQSYLSKFGPAGPVPLGFQEGDFTGDPVIDRRHWARAALLEPPAAALGEPKRIYENGNYIVVAAILERLTGKSWEQLMQEELFAPLDMKDAGFGPPGVAGEVAAPFGHHRDSQGEMKMYPPDGPERPDNPPVLGPSGRVHVSLTDMAKYMRDHIVGHQGGRALLPTASYHILHTPPFGDDYAMGWIVRESDGLGHGGTNGKWLAVVEIRPEQNIGIFVATNLGPPPETAPHVDRLMNTLFDMFAD